MCTRMCFHSCQDCALFTLRGGAAVVALTGENFPIFVCKTSVTVARRDPLELNLHNVFSQPPPLHSHPAWGALFPAETTRGLDCVICDSSRPRPCACLHTLRPPSLLNACGEKNGRCPRIRWASPSSSRRMRLLSSPSSHRRFQGFRGGGWKTQK